MTKAINTSELYSFEEILQVARQLEKDIIKLDFESLDLHESVKSYFRFDLTKIKYVSECNAYIIFNILNSLKINLKDHLIIDHGAGLGFFSFLLKRLGAQCICHDISIEYIEGIKILAQELNSIPDYYVIGDTDKLIEFCTTQMLKPTGLGSRNVIEHLPDYQQFFNQLSVLSPVSFCAVITTSANIHNPIVRKIHHKIHQQYENLGSNIDMDNPSINSANCGMKLRIEIIQTHFPKLDQKTIIKLAKNNRGFVKSKIINRVNEYLNTYILPLPFPEPSNTCDPLTGAWVERLVLANDYKNAANFAKFNFEILPGFYNTQYESILKNLIASLLNKFLFRKNPWRLMMSPFLAMKLIKK